ncbi:hypothetical protein CK203_002241 [Vitis vinifera]|uniref:Uncharacterized protein n=1 Tax=Vitis vinifera TaxID=29760 RepID=A0A438KIU7_VITVI|nr:hypothetical protein CK203_002241 [Vitis vinifera]
MCGRGARLSLIPATGNLGLPYASCGRCSQSPRGLVTMGGPKGPCHGEIQKLNQDLKVSLAGTRRRVDSVMGAKRKKTEEVGGDDEVGGGKKQILPSMIKNKEKRSAVHAKLKHQKKIEKRKKAKAREAAEKRALELGEEPPAKKIPHTIENTREFDETVCKPDDEEVCHSISPWIYFLLKLIVLDSSDSWKSIVMEILVEVYEAGLTNYDK